MSYTMRIDYFKAVEVCGQYVDADCDFLRCCTAGVPVCGLYGQVLVELGWDTQSAEMLS